MLGSDHAILFSPHEAHWQASPQFSTSGLIADASVQPCANDVQLGGNHFQLAMLAYNLNCWLMLFNREPQDDATQLRHTTLATSRLRFLFVAAQIWRHAGRPG